MKIIALPQSLPLLMRRIKLLLQINRPQNRARRLCRGSQGVCWLNRLRGTLCGRVAHNLIRLSRRQTDERKLPCIYQLLIRFSLTIQTLTCDSDISITARHWSLRLLDGASSRSLLCCYCTALLGQHLTALAASSEHCTLPVDSFWHTVRTASCTALTHKLSASSRVAFASHSHSIKLTHSARMTWPSCAARSNTNAHTHARKEGKKKKK